MATIHSRWDCESSQLPMCRICGRLPTAESSLLYSFVFVLEPSHSRSQAERFLWNRLACSDTKKICVCLLLILFYVSTQCFHACWHVHLIHLFHAHSAWIKISSKPRVKRSAVAPAWHRFRSVSRAFLKGKATSPPLKLPLTMTGLRVESSISSRLTTSLKPRCGSMCRLGISLADESAKGHLRPT